MAEHGITPSQTVGPFFAFGLTPAPDGFPGLIGNDLVTEDAVGRPIRIVGRILDGAGAPVPDAMIEIWQADGAGRFAGTSTPRPNAGFSGFGRCASDTDGGFSFRTVRPGVVAMPDGARQAPHIAVSVFARGLLRQLVTRIYFADEDINAADPVLALLPAERRGTLIAAIETPAGGEPAYRFDIRLQGADETVFFAA